MGWVEAPGIGVRDVVDERAERRLARGGDWRGSPGSGGGVKAGQHAGGDGFGVSFDAGNLSGEENGWVIAQVERLGEDARRVDISIAVNLAVAQELCVFKARNEAQDAGLLGIFQMILEADEV